MKYEGEANA